MAIIFGIKPPWISLNIKFLVQLFFLSRGTLLENIVYACTKPSTRIVVEVWWFWFYEMVLQRTSPVVQKSILVFNTWFSSVWWISHKSEGKNKTHSTDTTFSKLSISPNVHMFVCSLFWYLLKVFLPPLPKVGCPNFLVIQDPWGKVIERSCLIFDNFC